MSSTGVVMQQKASPQAGAGTRLVSLDALRGLTIAAMILVNNPGSSTVYWPLEHAEWNGWTPTDLIFPFFLFIVGVSMPFSFMRRQQQDGRQRLFLHVVYRSTILFVLGVFLNAFPLFNVHTFRIPGVLQRIALCYLFASVAVLTIRWRARLFTIATLLIGYWALMRFVPVPGFGSGQLTPEGNLAAFVDRAIFGAHIWRPTGDPEGLLSTIPAIATVLFGTFAGEWLRSSCHTRKITAGLLGFGILGLIVGRTLHPFYPINKSLWTGSYAIFTAGLACVLLALFYWLIDVRGWRIWARPFVVYGVNPILAYSASFLMTRSLVYSYFTSGGQRISTYRFLFKTVFAPLASPPSASLMFSMSYVLLWLAIMWVFYARKIYLKI
jgi:predicted acyltransferase